MRARRRGSGWRLRAAGVATGSSYSGPDGAGPHLSFALAQNSRGPVATALARAIGAGMGVAAVPKGPDQPQPLHPGNRAALRADLTAGTSTNYRCAESEKSAPLLPRRSRWSLVTG